MVISVFDRGENIVGKGENAGNQHFLLFPQCFPIPPLLQLLKVMIVWQRFHENPFVSTCLFCTQCILTMFSLLIYITGLPLSPESI